MSEIYSTPGSLRLGVLDVTWTAFTMLSLLARQARLAHWNAVRFYSANVRPLNIVGEEDLAHFTKILPESCILSTLPPKPSATSDELASFNTDWMGKYVGSASTVLKPKTTQQVSDIVKWCWERRIGIVPQGGNTGLVGGGVPLEDELLLNLGGMNKVRSFDPVSGVCITYWTLFHSASNV